MRAIQTNRRKAVLELGALFTIPARGDRQEELLARKGSQILTRYRITLAQEQAVLDAAEAVSEALQKVGVGA